MVSKAKGIIFILLLLMVGCISINEGKSLRISPDESLVIDHSSGIKIRTPLVVILSFDYEDRGTNIGTKNLPSIFQILEKHNATATFFIMGETADENPSAVKEIHLKGYSLGLHSSKHHFPLFTRDDALEIDNVYKTGIDYVWDRSFKTPEAFYEDLERNKKYVTTIVGDNVELKMFRSPSLVVNWTRDKEYFSTLKKAGIEIDSSIIRDFSDKEPVYSYYDIVEVPVSVSEARLSNVSHLNMIVERYSKGGLPFVMYIHPQRLIPSDLVTFDEFLTSMEEKYTVTYLKVDEITTFY